MDINKMKKVYILLLNYKEWEDTVECLESILKNDYSNYQIVVVDNASPNDSMCKLLAWAKGEVEIDLPNKSFFKYLTNPLEKKPLNYILYNEDDFIEERDRQENISLRNPIIFIQAKENNGFAKGNNIGIEYMMNQNDFSYIWLVNGDTVVEKNSLSTLLKYANTNDIGICGSKIMDYNTPKLIQSLGGHVNKFFGTSKHLYSAEDISSKLDYIIGASFLINKKVIDKISMLPIEYFLYFEETDYCFNARKNGFKLDIALESIVYHKEGGTTKDKFTNRDSEDIELLKLRNRMIFHKKYLGGGLGLYCGFVLVLINRILRRQFTLIPKILKLFR